MGEKYADLKQFIHEHASDDKPATLPLWRELLSEYDAIMKAKSKGVTFKEMAEKAGVTPKTFSFALKMARVERDKVKGEVAKEQEEEVTPSGRGLPPVPGSRKNKKKQFASIEI